MKKVLYTLSALFLSAVSFAQPCSDLFFSEYIEGSSNNKGVEIYNPTSGTVDLSQYEIRNYFNGTGTLTAPSNYILALSGSLAPGETYVVVHASAGTALAALADLVAPSSGTGGSAINFNGDDAVALYKNGTLIDVIGQIGTDPGTEWAWGTFSTLNHTLIRKASIQQGSTNWDSTTAVNNWDVLAQDDFSGTGNHSMTPCGPVTDTLVKFVNTSVSAAENAGTTNLNVSYAPTSAATAFSVDVVLKSGNAADINNYTTQTVNFPANTSTGSVTVTITDNALVDGNKTFVFALRNPSGALLLGTDSLLTLTVTDNDAPVVGPTVYTIAQVRGTNANGGPDSLNVTCELRGTVYGVNLRPNGLEFTINDGTAGISVFAPAGSNTFGYTPTEGDSIRVWGDVITFRGLAQIAFLDTIIVAGTGNVQNPTFTNVLNESTECELIRATNCTLVNAAQWVGGTSSFNVDCNCGGQAVTVRIHSSTTAISATAPTGTFDVIGIGSQFATTTAAPFTDGYQLIPRKLEDILYGGSISENEASSKLSVFPNPAQGRFFVQFESNISGKANVSLKDLTGRTVMSKNISLVSGNNQLEVNENLSAGVFLVSIEMGTTRAVKRVIVK